MSDQNLKPGWKIWRFEQMAYEVKDRIERPVDSGLERYVGLEHLDTGSLKIWRWGSTADVEKQKLLFKNGDIIFGRRNAYLRRVAVADFDGVCSAHAMVLRAHEDVILPEFLPFFMQTDGFWETALKVSAGSMSPTINWKNIAEETFALPPLEEQRHIAKLLKAIEENCEANLAANLNLELCRKSYLEHIFSKEYKHTNSLEKIATIISGGTPSRKRKDYWNGNIPWLSPKDMKQSILADTTEHITISAVENGAKLAPPGTIFVVVRGMILAHTFPVCRGETEMAFNQDVRAIVPSYQILPSFLHAWFEWAAPRYLQLVSESSHGTKRLETSQLLRNQVPDFSRIQQEEILAPLKKIDAELDSLASRQNQLSSLKNRVLVGLGGS